MLKTPYNQSISRFQKRKLSRGFMEEIFRNSEAIPALGRGVVHGGKAA